MHTEFLMGNEAMALGALAAGVNVVCGYPGTPSSEVLETVAKRRTEDTYVEWSVNEKAALELAAGAAYSGARALVTMKQVGLNVASDPLMSLEYVGVKGGMVVLVADDPGPISSQTEQDTRTFARFSKVPCFDPSSPAEAYEMIQDAFLLSEKYCTPVFLRPTTRVCHAYASLSIKDPVDYYVNKPEGFVKDSKRWVIFPKLSYANHAKIEDRNERLSESLSAYDKNGIIRFASKNYATILPAETAAGDFRSINQKEISSENSQEMGLDNAAKSAESPRRGVAAGGISFAYAKEEIAVLLNEKKAQKKSADIIETGNFSLDNEDIVSLLKVGTPFPFPETLALEFLSELDEVLVFEELDPVIERELTYICGRYGLKTKIFGKLSHHMPASGENSRDMIKKALAEFTAEKHDIKENTAEFAADKQVIKKTPEEHTDGKEDVKKSGQEKTCSATADDKDAGEVIEICGESNDILPPPALPIRPPVLCAGCPHRASFYAVKLAMKGKKAFFGGDIGCYTLGNAQPLDMVDTCLCMGAGVNIAQGIKRTNPDTTCFAFVGDSTFFASAITGVVNAVYNQADMTLVILDNSTTAMTGHQPHPGTGRTMMGDVVAKIDPVKILEGIGVTRVSCVDPLDLDKAVETVKEVSALPGVKAIIFKSPCIAIVKSSDRCAIDSEKCIGCKKCIRELGCPAIFPDEGKVAIDPALCTGCGLCSKVCPVGAIS